MTIEENLREMAATNGWQINEDTVTRIAKAKSIFFGIGHWEKCPCYPPEDTEHGCGTKACSDTIELEGKCHCNLYLKKS